MAAGQLTGALAGLAPPPARRLLVFLTMVVLIALSVVAPVAGTAIALVLLICLRAADVTGGWARQRSGQARAAAAAFYPWALVRSVFRFVALAPMALLCAAAGATVAALATGPAQLPRIGGWAAGALVACYCLGPGSAGCRRPVSQLYGRITRSSFGAAMALVCLGSLAAVAVVAAASMLPGYWPAGHLGQQLRHASLGNSFLSHLLGNLSRSGRQMIRWVGHRL